MIIQKKRIRSLERYIPESFKNKKLFISIPWIGNEKNANKVGFSTFVEGESVLPRKIGPITKYNADGKFIVRKDLPKEPYTIELCWTLTDRGGHIHSGVNYITKERYPRDFITPLENYITLTNIKGIQTILSKGIIYNDKNSEEILHIINLFLEIFGSCNVLDENMESYLPARIIKLNWELLPKGEYPREERKDHIKPFLSRLTKGKRALIEERFKFIESFHPETVGIGLNGFSGYFSFWFPKQNICVLECHEIYNATYILANNWSILSQLTKAELLQNDLYEKRIIHTQNWETEVAKLFK